MGKGGGGRGELVGGGGMGPLPFMVSSDILSDDNDDDDDDDDDGLLMDGGDDDDNAEGVLLRLKCVKCYSPERKMQMR